MPYATTHDGTRIHYELSGARGPWIVLVQGLGLSARHWGHLAQLLHERLGECRVLSIDNRGTGRSDEPKGLLTTANMADDVALVLDHARVPSAVVVGLSMGGMIAQHLALRHPHRVAALALLATTPGLPHGALPTAKGMAILAKLPLALRSSDLRSALADLFTDGLQAPALERLVEAWEPVLRTEALPLRTFLLQLAAVTLHSTGAQLHRIRCPTVVAAGEDDPILPAQNARRLARAIPDARLELLPGFGHALPAEDPQLVPRLAQQLLEERDEREVRRLSSLLDVA